MAHFPTHNFACTHLESIASNLANFSVWNIPFQYAALHATNSHNRCVFWSSTDGRSLRPRYDFVYPLKICRNHRSRDTLQPFQLPLAHHFKSRVYFYLYLARNANVIRSILVEVKKNNGFSSSFVRSILCNTAAFRLYFCFVFCPNSQFWNEFRTIFRDENTCECLSVKQ